MCFKTTSSSFFNRIVNLWNGLPVAIWTIYRVSLFSKKVNRFYISKDKTGLLSSAIFPIEKKNLALCGTVYHCRVILCHKWQDIFCGFISLLQH